HELHRCGRAGWRADHVLRRRSGRAGTGCGASPAVVRPQRPRAKVRFPRLRVGRSMAGKNVRTSRDAVADPWGSRSPYGQGETWPVRVDMRLDDGISVDDVDVWVQTASVLHSNGHAMALAVAG